LQRRESELSPDARKKAFTSYEKFLTKSREERTYASDCVLAYERYLCYPWFDMRASNDSDLIIIDTPDIIHHWGYIPLIDISNDKLLKITSLVLRGAVVNIL
jgi:hypothetical protein